MKHWPWWYLKERALRQARQNNRFVCDCSIHDITTPGAAHADDCPAATHND